MTDNVKIRTPGQIITELSAAVTTALIKKFIDDGLLYGRSPTAAGEVAGSHNTSIGDNAYIIGYHSPSAGLEFLTKSEYEEKITRLSNELDHCLKLLYVEKE